MTLILPWNESLHQTRHETGVGVFTSGMIDGLWEKGGDVSDAVLAGADALADAGVAIGDVGGAVVDGIGGLFG